jgi:DNA-binding response OmpR family regulator
VLVVDDEPRIRTVLRAYLEAEEFTVTEAETAAEAVRQATSSVAGLDLVLLDLGLPDADGLEVLRRIRQTSDVPVILVTARAEEVDKLVGLNVGADDYVTKPFSPREVVARVRTVLRRSGHDVTNTSGALGSLGSTGTDRGGRHTDTAHVLELDGLTIDEHRHEIHRDGQPITLSALEFDLLVALASAPGRVFSRAQLLEKVWGYDFYGDERVVDVHIRSLRKALGDDAGAPSVIGTVRGVGYKFLLAPRGESR